jgi:hypothetical protein
MQQQRVIVDTVRSLVAISSRWMPISLFITTIFVAIPHSCFTIRAWLTTILEGTACADLRHLCLELRELYLRTGERRIHIRRIYIDSR